MRIDIITLLPSLLESPFSHSILERAQQKELLSVHVHDLRSYGFGKHRQVDDYAYGGSAGMVMMAEPIARCIDDIQAVHRADEVIYMTPDGKPLQQRMANRLSLYRHLIILCGHYKGIDERIRETYVTMEISIGDYVLSGGELAAAVLVDAIGRLLPGVLSDETSALTDSHQDNLLAPPVYTRPATWRGLEVPDVLRSGHDAQIKDWLHDEAVKRTKERRPDLLS